MGLIEDVLSGAAFTTSSAASGGSGFWGAAGSVLSGVGEVLQGAIPAATQIAATYAAKELGLLPTSPGMPMQYPSPVYGTGAMASPWGGSIGGMSMNGFMPTAGGFGVTDLLAPWLQQYLAPAQIPQQMPPMGASQRPSRKPFVITDPATGRQLWLRYAGVPVLWSSDLSACRRVKKVAARARRRLGGR